MNLTEILLVLCIVIGLVYVHQISNYPSRVALRDSYNTVKRYLADLKGRVEDLKDRVRGSRK